MLHLVLTLLTCGLWLPVWFLVALSSPPRVMVVDEDGNVRRPPDRLEYAFVAGGVLYTWRPNLLGGAWFAEPYWEEK